LYFELKVVRLSEARLEIEVVFEDKWKHDVFWKPANQASHLS
jgi:hypothetical protein